jgi:uncharacterized protein YecE (DUF72 family)
MAPSINRRGVKPAIRPINRSVSLESQGLVRASCMNRRLVGLMPAVKPGSSNGAVPLPDRKFAIEIRNRPWLNAEFANLLRDHGIALVLQDRSWMPNPSELDFDPITADWTYIRWLGDRREIEAQTMTWDKVVVDRSAELSSWVDFCCQIMRRGVLIYAYANNHFQGHGPATIAKFLELWAANGFGKIAGPERRKQQQTTLFPLLD